MVDPLPAACLNEKPAPAPGEFGRTALEGPSYPWRWVTGVPAATDNRTRMWSMDGREACACLAMLQSHW